MRFLSAADVASLGLSADQVRTAVELALAGLASGSAIMAPRPTLEAANGARFMAFPVILGEAGVAGVKWLGIVPSPTAGAGQATHSCIVMSSIEDGTIVGLVEAAHITAVRTAMVSCVAAEALARSDSSRIAFVACGEQARLHLELFAGRFPLSQVACWSRSRATAERFAANARSMGFGAEAFETLRGCVEGADIVVTSSPAATTTLLEPDWLAPGCFVSLVDLGRSMRTEALSADDAFVVDDGPQFEALAAAGVLKRFGAVRSESLAARMRKPLHRDPDKRSRSVFLPTGLGVADVVIAWDLLKSASERGTGLELRPAGTS